MPPLSARTFYRARDRNLNFIWLQPKGICTEAFIHTHQAGQGCRAPSAPHPMPLSRAPSLSAGSGLRSPTSLHASPAAQVSRLLKPARVVTGMTGEWLDFSHKTQGRSAELAGPSVSLGECTGNSQSPERGCRTLSPSLSSFLTPLRITPYLKLPRFPVRQIRAFHRLAPPYLFSRLLF